MEAAAKTEDERTMLQQDFVRFSALHVASGDVDPLYGVLKHLIQDRDPEGQTEDALTYVAFYSLPSAMRWRARVSGQSPEQWAEPDAYLPTGIERRSLRGGKNMLRHLRDVERLREEHGGLRRWLMRDFQGDPKRDWITLQETTREAWGNGRWAAYKTAEICQKVLGYPVEPSDMGNAGSTGPRRGLELLFGPSTSVMQLDLWGSQLHRRLRGFGVHLDLAEVETCLCDFHSMYQGHYYVGHDIDQMQEQIVAAKLPPEDEVMLWEARAAVLRPEYLGELNGWTGVDKERARQYRDSGEIVSRG